MKLKTKKTIAKEIIIFFGIILFDFVILAIILGWNAIQKNKENKLVNEGEEIENQLNAFPNNIKAKINNQENFYNLVIKHYEVYKYKFSNFYDLWERTVEMQDTLYEKFTYEFQKNFNSEWQFKNFIKKNSFLPDERIYEKKLSKILSKQNDLNIGISYIQGKIIDSDEILAILMESTIIFLIMIYPIRFSILLLKWSIKVLKEKQV